MTINEVCQKYDISKDTLRYYERVGMIPPVHRTESGIRNYTSEDEAWVELCLCMRSAGLSIEVIIEYVKLYRQGDKTIAARLKLLQRQKDVLLKRRQNIDVTLERLNFKIARYEIAVETGSITWADPKTKDKLKP